MRRATLAGLGALCALAIAAITALAIFIGSDQSSSETPSTVAWAANGAAHAEFHPSQSQFFLFDDRSDYHSAVLKVKIDGVLQTPWFNSTGKTGSVNRAGATGAPKTIAIAAVKPGSVIEFQVCVGDANQSRQVLEETCGPWTK